MERTAKKKIKLYKPKQTGTGGGDFYSSQQIIRSKMDCLNGGECVRINSTTEVVEEE